jgi:ABC-type oligopeptide transport system substrate-binding subunit
MMNRKRMLTFATLALLSVALLTTAACKSSGMAVTERGQLMKINIEHPKDLPEAGEDNLDITISNRGVNNLQNVVVDVEVPPQLVVLEQTADRGITVSRDPGSNVYHFTMENIQPTENSSIRFRVRTAFGTWRETGSVKVTAWQRDLPGDRLVETAVIKLRQ